MKALRFSNGNVVYFQIGGRWKRGAVIGIVKGAVEPYVVQDDDEEVYRRNEKDLLGREEYVEMATQ